MSELSKLIKGFITASIITLLIALVLCGVFIAGYGTEKMIFG